MGIKLPRDVRVQYESKAWELRRQFWTHERIAKEFGITRQAVTAMLSRLERRELARLQARVEQVKARQTAQLETIASEAYDAWLHSKTPQVIERITSERMPAPPAGQPDIDSPPDVVPVDLPMTVVTETKTHQCDSSLLNQVRGALADIRDIWGINAPIKSQADITSGGQPLRPTIVEIVRPDGVTDSAEPSPDSP